VLALKCTLVPLLILAATLATRRWGARSGGLIAGLPFVGLAVFLVLALERGAAFAAAASLAGTAGLAAYVAYGVAYCWASQRLAWPLAYAAGACAWVAVAALATQLPQTPLAHVLAGAAALAAGRRLLPPDPPPAMGGALARDNLPGRMAAGAALTILVSMLAKPLGGAWAGMLSVYPILGSITLIGAHRSGGADEATRLFRGMMAGAWSAVVSFLLLALLLPVVPVAPAFLIASAAALCPPAAFLLLKRRDARPACSAGPA